MNSAKYRFVLDLHSVQSKVSIRAIVGDTSRRLCISLSDGGEPYFIDEGCLAKITIVRPTRSYAEDFCAIENNTVIYDFKDYTAIEEGIHECSLTLYDSNGGILGTPRFTMEVSGRVVGDVEISDYDRSVIDAIVEAEAKRQADFDKMMEDLANGKYSGGGSNPLYSSVTLRASAWVGVDDPYSQVVSIEGVTPNSKVDLLPSVDQLAIFHDKDIAFVTENDDGVVAVYAIGDKPTRDYTIEVCITEVVV